MAGSPNFTALHYTGAEHDRGGIMSVVHTLAATGTLACVLGVSEGFEGRRRPALPTLVLPRIAAEKIGPVTWWRARMIARQVQSWLAQDGTRIFHGHSRAGLLVALHLAAWREKRSGASVHCYGRQRWFYRHAARRLGKRLFWLTPEMKRYYGIEPAAGWAQCIPPCVRIDPPAMRRRAGVPGALRIAGVGALVPWKGWHLMLEALGQLPESQRAGVLFQHIGSEDGSDASRHYAEALRARTRALGIESLVEWRGEALDSTALLAESDVLAILSDAEPFSVAMLEAWRSGVPVLASRAGGPKDVLAPPRNGWFFTSGDVADLARVLGALIGPEARAQVEIRPEDLAPYTAETVAARWAAVYRSWAEP